MQEISLEQLKQLLPGKLQENDDKFADDLSFRDLCKEYGKIQIRSVNVKHAYDRFVREILFGRKSIKFVGDGSSRSAFACVGGKCLKVAKYESGIAQNKQEEKHTARHWWKRGYDCFAETYGHNEDYALLLAECCSKIKSQEELANAFGIDESAFTAAIRTVAKEKNHDIGKSATSLRTECAVWKKSGGSENGL